MDFALFDIDGVLVKPGGYRAAMRATVHYFLDQMGLAELTPGNEIAELFESFGVTSEWDMIPAALAVAFDAILENHDPGVDFQDLRDGLVWAQGLALDGFQINFEKRIAKLGAIMASGGTPSEALLSTWQAHSDPELLAFIGKYPTLMDVFRNTRDMRRSWTGRIFQNFVLGSEVFKKTYGCIPEVNAESSLEKFDHSQLNPEIWKHLMDMRQMEKLAFAVFTARPSMQPAGIEADPMYYSPEAEMALGVLDMVNIPMIGYGKLYYLAEKLGISAEDLLKPSPVQALAGLAAAWTGEEWPSLVWAYELWARTAGKPRGNFETYPIHLPEKFGLHVFEDFPGGIRAAQQAGMILASEGYQVETHAWGIAANPHKVKTLTSLGAMVFTDVNGAIQSAFSLNPE